MEGRRSGSHFAPVFSPLRGLSVLSSPRSLVASTIVAPPSSSRQAVCLLVEPNSTPRNRRVMLDNARPPPRRRLRQHPPLGLERNQRLHVVPHDPRKRQVRGGRDEVGEIDRAVAVVLE